MTINSNLLLHTYFKSEPTDIVLASFMKSGTTWLKALMFSTLNRDRYSFSNHYLHNNSPQSTFPFLDVESYPMTDFTTFPAPRLFATHFAQTLLLACMSSCKFVYVCRDPKDVLVSKWHFMSKLRSKDLPPLSFDEAFELFCLGKQPDVVVRKLADFMGKPITMEEEKKGVVGEIINVCSFENLRNLEVNKKGVEKFGKLVELEKQGFFRKGEIGDWKNHLSEKMKDRIDGIIEQKFKGSGLIGFSE
ncbi:hypothetical protein R6Q57_009683 [Mikania cordata]